MKGRILVVSGPSASGKDTILDALMERSPLVSKVTTYTTRAQRDGEVNGEDYHFVTPEQFDRLIEEGLLLEWKKVHGKLYGSPIEETDRLVAAGRIAVLKIDVQGAEAVLEKRPDAVTVFIMAPSLEVLEARMRNRRTETEESIRLRLSNAAEEIKCASWYQHVLINDSVERAVAELQQILERLK